MPRATLRPLPASAAGAERRAYEGQVATPLKPSLLTLALMLLFADIVAVILLQLGGQGSAAALKTALSRRRPVLAIGVLAAS